jgi:microcompartment protein CcmK/EutM
MSQTLEISDITGKLLATIQEKDFNKDKPLIVKLRTPEEEKPYQSMIKQTNKNKLVMS